MLQAVGSRPPNTVLMVGTPRSGKTSYLAALWYSLREREAETELSLVRLPEDSAYLSGICRAWVDGNDVGRTTGAAMQRLKLTLELAGEECELVVPDLSGEVFQRHFSQREWSAEFAALVEETSGVLVFLHPSHLGLPVSLTDVAGASARVRTTPPERSAKTTESTLPGSEAIAVAASSFAAKDAPAAVILTDELQQMVGQPGYRPELRVSVVVSAWDLVDADDPVDWLAKNAPLLSQFLRNSFHESRVRVFGVSALGGRLESSEERARLLSMEDPLDRVRVVGSNASSVDDPLKWLMDPRT